MGKFIQQVGEPLTERKINPFFWQSGVNPAKLRLLDHWAIGHRAVDIGCGNGLYAQYLRQNGFDVIALDAEDRVNDKTGIEFLLTTVPPIPLPDKCCDTLILFDVLEHITAEDALLAEIKRLTTRRLILSVPADDDGALPLYGLCLLHHVDKTHQREYNPTSLQMALGRHKFKVIHLESQFPTSLPLVTGEFFIPTFLGRFSRIVTLMWLKILMRSGLIRVQLPADWFVVADLLSE